jgi:hypothetical protein
MAEAARGAARSPAPETNRPFSFARATLAALTLMLVALAAEASVSEVRIITEPEGADVWVGILHLGTTTREGVRVLLEKPVTVTFKIRKAGYVTVETTVRVTPLWELPYWSVQHPPPTVIVVPLQRMTAEAPPREPEATARERPRNAEPPPTLRIPRVSRPPKVEEFLQGKPRLAGAWIMDFRQREPGDGVQASKETSAYLSYDHKNLYVVVVCREEPEKVRARMAKREDIGGDDQVAVYLDTFHDQRRAYLFAVNPRGVQSDLILTEGQSPDLSFDALWHSKGRLTPTGFVAWMAIPFQSLRFPNAPEQRWGIALGRFIPHNQEDSFWPYITNRIEGFSQQMATLEGMKNIASGHSVQVIPYGVFSRVESRASSEATLDRQEERRGGVDAKVVLAGAFTLDGTWKPDFSQVETDDPQVTVNQRFEVYFPEKRPFFMENAGFFETPVKLFFSRRVLDPQFGAKLTGKAGGWAVGALGMDDRFQAIGNGFDGSPTPKAEIGVVRLQRDLKRESIIGLLATSRELGPDFNRVFSVDGRLKLSPNIVFSGQVMRSETREANGATRSGSGYFANLLYGGRNFTYGGSYQDLDPNFRASLGFVPRVDIRQTEHFASYVWRPGSRVLVNLGPSITGLVNWDRKGQVQDWFVGSEFSVLFSGPTQLKVARSESLEIFEGQRFRKSGSDASFYTEGLNWLGVSASYAQGTDVNYHPAPGLLPFLANSVSGSVGLTLRPTSRMRLENTYLYNRLGGTLLFRNPAQDTVYANHLARLKVEYQFTRALSLRATLDYEVVKPNQSLIQLEYSRRLDGDFLLTWLLHPGTALHIGYNNRYDDVADPLTTQAPRFPRLPGTLRGKELFIKLSYLLRF